MRWTWILIGTLWGCGDGDPLGGPHGGTSDPYGPNGGDPSKPASDPNNMPADDSGAVVMSDGGTIKKDGGSGTQDSGNNNQMLTVTWTQIYTAYLAGGTIGNCSHCHGSCGSKSGCYTWLQGKGYISGMSSGLVSQSQSCLSWYGGNMPPSGPKSLPQATTDMNAWAKAGAANN